MQKRRVRIAGIILAVIIATAVAASYLADEPIRRKLERELNARLKGYSVRIGKLTTHPLTLSVDLHNFTVVQKKNPTPPLAVIKTIQGGVHWRSLLTGHIVADARMDNPKLSVNIANLKAEVKKPPAEKEAWQDALKALTPITLNEIRIRDGEIAYFESAENRPVTVSGITFVAHNIKNVESRERPYPSDLFLEADLFGSKVTVKGRADFLRKPYAAVKADFELHDLDLTHFTEIARSRHVTIEKGAVTGTGSLEFTPEQKIIILQEFALKGAVLDYDYIAKPVPGEIKKKEKGKAAEEVKELEKKYANKPGLLVKAKRIRVSGSTVGIVNVSAKPSYRVFIDALDLELENFSNHFSEGPAELRLTGRFMGSGATDVTGTFRPEKQGPDFNIKIAIKNTSMPAMNNIFRAYGKFDVTKGLFSFYSDLTVKNDKVTGYVKPLFREMKVYDKRQDKEKNAFRKLYEEIVGGVSKLLESRQRKAVATKTPVEGNIENPEAGTRETLVKLIQNAFFHAILPGFEKNIK
jgi:hypothetical protein